MKTEEYKFIVINQSLEKLNKFKKTVSNLPEESRYFFQDEIEFAVVLESVVTSHKGICALMERWLKKFYDQKTHEGRILLSYFDNKETNTPSWNVIKKPLILIGCKENNMKNLKLIFKKRHLLVHENGTKWDIKQYQKILEDSKKDLSHVLGILKKEHKDIE